MQKSSPGNSRQTNAEAIGKGYMIGIQAVSISIQIALLPVLGLWVDKKLGTTLVFGAIGLVLGLYSGIMQLNRLGKKQHKPDDNSDIDSDKDSENDSSSLKK